MQAEAVSCTERLIVMNANVMQTLRHYSKLKVHQRASNLHETCAFTFRTASDMVYRNITILYLLEKRFSSLTNLRIASGLTDRFL